jgi:ABC-type phosphate transport system substrate-binding protein
LQIEFGLEGAALVTSVNGPAAECLEKLGGLSIDQLRWMFSGMTEQQLIQEYDGWDSSEVPYSDGIGNTRLWSELHSDCQPVEISIVGTASSSPVHVFFADKILKAAGESIDPARFLGETETKPLIDRLEGDKNAIGFLNIRYVISEQDESVVADRLKTVPIREVNKNSNSTFTDPEVARFEDQKYPLTSNIYFNINDEASTWTNVRPFLEFAFSEQGTRELINASFWPIPRWKQEVMKARAQTATAVAMEDIICGPEGSTISIAGSSTVFPVSQICACRL